MVARAPLLAFYRGDLDSLRAFTCTDHEDEFMEYDPVEDLSTQESDEADAVVSMLMTSI